MCDDGLRFVRLVLLFFTLNEQCLGLGHDPGLVSGHAGEVGVVLGTEVVDPQHALELADDADFDGGVVEAAGAAAEAANGHVVAVPGQGQGQVALRHRAQDGDPLAQAQVLVHRELVETRGNFWAEISVYICEPLA